MQPRQDNPKRQESLLALIEQQWLLVQTGKDPQQLIDLLYNYEMDILTSSISENQPLLQKYVWALLIAGNYSELSFFLRRNKQVHQGEKLVPIADAGSKQDLKILGSAVQAYLETLQDKQLVSRIQEGTLSAILKHLRQHFINFSIRSLQELFSTTEQQINELGYTVKDGFIDLPTQESQSDCLLPKLKELALVADKMSKKLQ